MTTNIIPLRHREAIDLIECRRRVSQIVVDMCARHRVNEPDVFEDPIQTSSMGILKLRIAEAGLGVESVVVHYRPNAWTISCAHVPITTTDGSDGWAVDGHADNGVDAGRYDVEY